MDGRINGRDNAQPQGWVQCTVVPINGWTYGQNCYVNIVGQCGDHDKN